MKYLKDEDLGKDAVMEIYEKLVEDLKRHEVSNLKSWLHSVARNHCLMQLRSEKSKAGKQDQFLKTEDDFVEFGDLLHPSSEQQKETLLLRLENAVAELNEQQRQCIELFYLQQKCYNEVADITGFSLKEVKSYIQNGKRNLKVALTKDP